MSMKVALLLVSVSVFACTAANNGGSQQSAGSSGQTSAAGSSAGGNVSSSAGSAAAGAPSAGAMNAGGATNIAGATNGGATNNAGASGSAGSAGASGGASVGGAAGAAGAGTGGAVASGCSGVTGAKFCEDWDKLPMGKPVGDYSVSSSGVVVDNSKAFSGTQSLHFLKNPKPATANSPFINFTKQFPLASNDLHGRIMYFMAETPKTDSHWDFITSRNSGNTEWSIGGQDGIFELVCDPPDNGLNSKTAWPSGKWVCMQWEYKYPGSTDTTFLAKVDGVAVDKGDFTGANSNGEKWVAGTWSNLKFDWEVFGKSDVDVEFWIDDLAFGEQPIPCPTM